LWRAKRRLIFCNRYFHPDHSATSQMLSDLAFALAAHGHTVHVVTSRLRYDDPSVPLPERETIKGVEVHRVRTTGFGRGHLGGRALDYLSFYLAATLRLLRLVRAGDLVVAKTDPPLIAVPAGWVAGWRRARLVNWLQDLFPEVAGALGMDLGKGAVGSLLVWLRTRSLQVAAVNVAIGEGMRGRLLELGVAPARLAVVHNWADDERIRPLAAAANPLRREWGLGDKFVVGYSGNLGRAHEFETLLAAAERLREQDDIVFLFIGGGASMEGLRAEAKRRGTLNLTFRPYQPAERLAESLTLPDLHLVVLRPEMEGLIVPSKFYGIAAAGRPTVFVGSPDGEIAGVLSAGQAGLAVSQGNGAGLANAILRLRDDRDLREGMGRHARRLCDERFSRRAALKHWEEVLSSAWEN
jgi:glycosyltransferase involved in cell wall biosynthesis